MINQIFVIILFKGNKVLQNICQEIIYISGIIQKLYNNLLNLMI